jgi:hypothetical protein
MKKMQLCRMGLRAFAVAVALSAYLPLANAQGIYDISRVYCIDDPPTTNQLCCGFIPVFGCDWDKTIPNQPGTNGLNIVNAKHATVLTCDYGTTYPSREPYQPLCVWQETGSSCGVPWGPVQKEKRVDAYNCISGG